MSTRFPNSYAAIANGLTPAMNPNHSCHASTGATSAFYSVEKATAASREMAARRARDGEASSDRDGDDDAGLG